jgi:AMP deaminase
MATPVTAVPSKVENSPLIVEKRPASPTSSLKTNASSSTLPAETATQPYQQFPSQAARIATSHAQSHAQPDGTNSIANGSPLQHAATFPHSLTSPHLSGIPRGPVEGFADLHLSGSEPRIFPGVVSRTQRRDSQVRKSSWSETDESVGTRTRKGTKGMDEAVEEESDKEMEEAGGSD